jgi:hypothetical protein
MYVDRSNLPGRSPQGGQNDGIFAKFSLEPVKMEFLSAQEGRPIFEDREHVTIYIAGDNRTEVFREASDDDKARFAEPMPPSSAPRRTTKPSPARLCASGRR